jgi:hypothetical protein
MKPCKHESVRYLDCDLHGKDCQEVICCDCGETIKDRVKCLECGHNEVVNERVNGVLVVACKGCGKF